MFKRLILLAAAAFAPLACLSADQTADWPAAKPLTLIVPVSAGGNVDTTARLVAQKLGDRLKQSIIVENIAGAGGVVGVGKAIHAAADGYTVVMGFDGPISVAHLINPAVKYDAEHKLAPVGLVSTAPVVMVARPGLAVNSVQDMLALARQEPGRLTYATSGVGTVHHLAAEVMQEQAGVQLTHVPYRGGAQIANDVMGGQVDLGMLVTTSATPLIQHGKLRALGVTSASRVGSLPQVPALGETPDLKGFDLNTWTGLFVPTGTPASVIARLNEELNAVLKMPDVIARLQEGGATPGEGTPASFADFLKKEQATYAHIVDSAHITQD
ncbi:Bug family tripartite tricarboxylate transporter substrate binding protein [Bordetella avium]|uniref:Bug family tripartite tricarboxylate transporter substrate binding protein n=1 Tax=Bordetella avium TaxID=521 RepID=UPI000E0C4595|nr:tripartite tricarboxylate transporter substrate-binding protein [Bordetella avium]AZY53854.1 ABC transporter substrate-binding protein [Bordetella avium]RIQ15373.1 tripartite tricarboxylate transporter substrate binding protein [Bordetella avium]RIQ38815.1 tripartite tricarboxylate transporter substrate binding protein [Bordetella avium]RIQ43354.1 tripartite tricarboxylate transporter substrate binding protein [Bordetella avium]RIQ44008.1 tripartite tricarboxylate transporter substrate bind